MTFKIIMRAGDIPIDSVVTKRTGQKPYIITDQVRFFAQRGKDDRYPNVKADPDIRFLSPVEQHPHATPSINIITVDTELVWHASRHGLQNLLDGEIG